MGVITDICQSIDFYNRIEQLGYRSLRVKFNQKRLRNKIQRTVDKLYASPLTVETICDFCYNYLDTTNIIELDNCECVDNYNQNQFVFTIKNGNGSVVYSVRKYYDPDISISIRRFSNMNIVKRLKYMNQIDHNPKFDDNTNSVGFKCSELFKAYISEYLNARLNLHKIQKEEKDVKEKSDDRKYGTE